MKLRYSFEEALANLRYGGLINLLCLAIIALTVTILSALVLVAVHVQDELRRLRDSPSVVVFLEDSVDASSAHRLRSQFEKLGDVRTVTYVSKSQALERARTIFGENADAVISGFDEMNPLPASLEVHASTTEPDKVERIAKEIATYPGVEQVEYERSGTAFIRKAQFVLIGLGLLFGTASLVIVCFSIMLTVYFRREELRIMRLVGATYWYIRIPLLLTGAVLGIFGSSLGLALFYGVFRLLKTQLGDVYFLSFHWISLILLVGCLIGLLGGSVPVRRYMNA